VLLPLPLVPTTAQLVPAGMRSDSPCAAWHTRVAAREGAAQPPTATGCRPCTRAYERKRASAVQCLPRHGAHAGMDTSRATLPPH